ncbi:MAG: hypothetical protein CME10_05315 [Gemmatimonadetes bacterium]|nr:hypothetical protein [Gemmatimonadota bacterium]
MPIRIATNLSSINAQRHLGISNASFSQSLERISSGLRINQSADDVAGLSVSQGMRGEIRGIVEGVRNAEAGTNLVQQAEGALNEINAILLRMRDLAVTSSNATINDGNRGGIEAEFNQLSSEIDRIVLSTAYNGENLLTGFGNTVSKDVEVSTVFDGFSGVKNVDLSGAVPGTYIFSDDDNDDNQISLSVTHSDGTVQSQTIDIGSMLDRHGGQNMVATGTTLVANFDRLGVSVTLMGEGIDSGGMYTTSVKNAVPGGTLIIEDIVVDFEPNTSLDKIAGDLNNILQDLNPPGSAVFLPDIGEVRIDTGGREVNESPIGFLGLSNLNKYIDGSLDGKKILVGEGKGGVLQVGTSGDSNDRISFSIGDLRSSGSLLNLGGLSVANIQSARFTIARVDQAIYNVARQRGDLGAVQNRLQYTSSNLGSAIENITAAESVIRDADIAQEVSELTRSQILTQAAQSMVAQANSLPRTALELLR